MRNLITTITQQLLAVALLALSLAVQAQINPQSSDASLSGVSFTESIGNTNDADNKSTQEIQIDSPGWYLISSYMNLSGNSISDLLLQVAGKFFAVIDEDGNAYIPSMFFNNIGNWQAKAYKVYFTQPCTIYLTGNPIVNPVFTVEGPVTFLPVLSNTPVEITDIFQGHLSDIAIIYDMNNLAFWTNEVQFFYTLNPGDGYLLLTNEPTISFTIGFYNFSEKQVNPSISTTLPTNSFQSVQKSEKSALTAPWIDIQQSEIYICNQNVLDLYGLVDGGNYSDVYWYTGIASGIFEEPFGAQTVYYPSAIDYQIGYADLYVIVSDGVSQYDSDQVRVYFVDPPTIFAGNDVTLTTGNSYTLSNATGENCSSWSWYTTGDGYFDNASVLNPTYFFGPNDIYMGYVELCVDASGLGDCISAYDCITLTLEIFTTSDNITLNAGWNLISLDVIPFSSSPEEVFAPLISASNLEMVTGFQNQMGVFFDPEGLSFLNTLTQLVPGEGYWVNVTNAATLSVLGEPISETFSINLKAGWNLIGYWLPDTTTPEEAFASLETAGVLEMATGYDQGGQMFDPAGLPFLNTLTEIKNGCGYWVKVNADYNSFSYPASWDCGDLLMDDRDGKTYETLQIGTQCWMKQNLNIGNRIDGANSQTNNGTIEKYCYNNLETNCDIYGGLYQWNEMMQYSTIEGVQGICPTGWYVPNDAEWTALTTYVSSQPAYLCNSNTSYIAKALAATTNWSVSTNTCAVGNNLTANNATGVSGLPAGYYYSGSFYSQGMNAFFWSASQYSTTGIWGRYLSYSDGNLYRDSNNQTLGFSVRCLKD